MPLWLRLLLLEAARLVALWFACLLLPFPKSHTNDAEVSLTTLPFATAGLISYLLLTSVIGSNAPRYGFVSTALQAAVIAFGVYTFLNYWSVLR